MRKIECSTFASRRCLCLGLCEILFFSVGSLSFSGLKKNVSFGERFFTVSVVRSGFGKSVQEQNRAHFHIIKRKEKEDVRQ